jgi:hypothetical protein
MPQYIVELLNVTRLAARLTDDSASLIGGVPAGTPPRRWYR